jgi:AcrR family transcriptional regulator
MYERVLDAAEACYDSSGWARPTMDEVARVGGVSRGYIYKHFVNRDGLMLAVLVRRAEMYNQRAHQFIAAQENLTEALVKGILLGVTLAGRDPYFGKLVSAATSDPERRIDGAMEAAERVTADLWRPVLEVAHDQGELRPGIEIDDILEWITMLSLGLLANRQVLGITDEAQERQLRTLFAPAIVREAPSAVTSTGAVRGGRHLPRMTR